jgi:hypothetical protein
LKELNGCFIFASERASFWQSQDKHGIQQYPAGIAFYLKRSLLRILAPL